MMVLLVTVGHCILMSDVLDCRLLEVYYERAVVGFEHGPEMVQYFLYLDGRRYWSDRGSLRIYRREVVWAVHFLVCVFGHLDDVPDHHDVYESKVKIRDEERCYHR